MEAGKRIIESTQIPKHAFCVLILSREDMRDSHRMILKVESTRVRLLRTTTYQQRVTNLPSMYDSRSPLMFLA